MNKLLTKIAGGLLGLSLAVGLGVAVCSKKIEKVNADSTETFSGDISSSISRTAMTFTPDKGSNSNAPTSAGRIYPGNTLTFESKTGYVLTGMTVSGKVNANKSGKYPTSWTITDGTSDVSTDEITGTGNLSGVSLSGVEKETLVFSCAGSAGNIDVSSIVVSYKSASSATLVSIAVSGEMTKTSYSSSEPWDPTGLTVTGTYSDDSNLNLTSSASFTYFNASDVEVPTPADLGAGTNQTLKVVATVSNISNAVKYVASTSISVVQGATYNMSSISNFSDSTIWSTTYGSHTVTHTLVGETTAANIVLPISNKQSSGIGSTYPAIGSKNATEQAGVEFELTEASKKISSVTLVFAVRGSSHLPTMKLYKGAGFENKTPLDTFTVSGSDAAGEEKTLSYANLNDTKFTVTHNSNDTSKAGIIGLKSISIQVVSATAFNTLNHIAVTSLPDVTVYHIGETYSQTGLSVTAYDGVDEASANFKDVTSSASFSFANGTVLTSNHVPGVEVTVTYTENAIEKETSFSIDVYALAEYELIESTHNDWSGNYLIVDTNPDSDLAAMNGGLTNTDSVKNYKLVEDNNGIIEAGQELEFVITAVTGGYSIQGKNGKYIGSLTTSDNGMLVSNSALVNTITYENDGITIAGTNGRKLDLYSSADRFRYYTTGSVQLYKKIESDAADEFAQTFLGAFTCDDSGTNKPSFTIKEGQTYWTWALLASQYSALDPTVKEDFRLGSASDAQEATNIQKALARYDYVVGKYYQTGLDTSFTDFIGRNPKAIGLARISLGSNNEMGANSIALIVVISMTSVGAIAGYFFIRKRRVI